MSGKKESKRVKINFESLMEGNKYKNITFTKEDHERMHEARLASEKQELEKQRAWFRQNQINEGKKAFELMELYLNSIGKKIKLSDL